MTEPIILEAVPLVLGFRKNLSFLEGRREIALENRDGLTCHFSGGVCARTFSLPPWGLTCRRPRAARARRFRWRPSRDGPPDSYRGGGGLVTPMKPGNAPGPIEGALTLDVIAAAPERLFAYLTGWRRTEILTL